jgi:dimethylaniline monooxygenase (N-oxide forming)
MAFNIFDEAPQVQPKHAGTPRETAEAIFLQHATEGTTIAPGAAFKAAVRSLGNEYPHLKPLENVALEGRLFEIIDDDGSGVIELEEFIDGVQNLLEPTQARYSSLMKRIDQGFVGKVENDFSNVKKVGIVGGGVAGLQVARALSKIGKECVIFEKSDNVGGVWRANYADFGLQVPKELYEFPEFPYPSGEQWEKFPPGPQVQKYIESYANHFDLKKMIRFKTGVHAIESKGAAGGRGYKICFGQQGGEPQEEEFDFVVVATGMYGWPPHIPTVRGQDQFKGQIAHSCTFQDATVCKGKKVVVVGGGKSAIDNAVAAAKHGEKSTLVYRSPHWPVPRYLLDLVPFKWGTYSRFGHFMLPTHYEVSNLAWYMHSLLTPIKWTWWRIVELMFRFQFRLPSEMVPKTPIEVDVFTGGQILTYEFRDMLKKGEVDAKKGSLEKMTEKSVILQDGTEIEADVVVFGTGFTKHYDLLDRLLQNRLDKEKDGLYLYRNVIPPRLPNIAFVGAEVSTFNNILTHGLQAEWLSRVIDGQIHLPSEGGMTMHVEKEQAWKRSWMPPTSARASIFQLHMMKYHDRLLKDMGENHRRKGVNILGEIFAPYCAADYRPIFSKSG